MNIFPFFSMSVVSKIELKCTNEEYGSQFEAEYTYRVRKVQCTLIIFSRVKGVEVVKLLSYVSFPCGL